MIERIAAMLDTASGDGTPFPPTVLYNENWMLRLVLDCLAASPSDSSPVPVAIGARWYSEARLPSAFLARYRGDPLAESHTHADGVLGHFSIGGTGKSDLVLGDGASQLSVIEGKMFSRLSPGVTNAPGFDQAARNVACTAEVLRRAGRHPSELSHLTFHVVAPQVQVEGGAFWDLVTKESIRRKVQQRVGAYEGALDDWFEEWFLPTLHHISVGLVSWEQLMDHLSDVNPDWGRELSAFYEATLGFNAVS